MAKAGVEWGWRNFLLMLSDSMFLCFSSVVLRIELRALYVAGKCSIPEPHSSALLVPCLPQSHVIQAFHLLLRVRPHYPSCLETARSGSLDVGSEEIPYEP